jgi:protein-S-isoprenylcysteine O-methyltransferase Ste14
MEIPFYFRLFYIPILNMIISGILALAVKAKRMKAPELTKPMQVVQLLSFVGLCVLMWFVPFQINLAFWFGICIIVFGQVVFALGYAAMREYPERKEVVVDWGIYGICRHSHIMAGLITTLGAVVMGWNMHSTVYVILWAYFVLDILFSHIAVLYEERKNIEKFGKEYEDYRKRVPRYF